MTEHDQTEDEEKEGNAFITRVRAEQLRIDRSAQGDPFIAKFRDKQRRIDEEDK